MKSKKHIAHADQNTQDGGYQGYYNERHCSRACWKREKVQLAAPLFSSPPFRLSLLRPEPHYGGQASAFEGVWLGSCFLRSLSQLAPEPPEIQPGKVRWSALR